MGDNKKIAGFKKFSDIKSKSKIEEVELNSRPETDSDIPANPNIPMDSNKIEKPISRKSIQTFDQDVNLPTGEDNEFDSKIEGETNEKVETFGKVAKFPKNVKASRAYNFMENVKISKKSIWYLMIEKDQNQLQLVKYNVKEGVDLNKFVNDLKTYYLSKYKEDKSICEAISKLEVDGNDKYSMVKGITPIEIEGRKLVSKITEDLIKLLSK
jgi:hypothetical protein